MSQVTSGIRSILAVPFIYDFFLDLVGVTEQRKVWIRDYLKPFAGARILDIGCGTAELLNHLPPSVEYTGFDMSQAYIDAARRRYGSRGRFSCAKVEPFESAGKNVDGAESGVYDLVMAFGVLHHLDDDEARQVFQGARRVLKPTGRFVTLDPAFIPNQSALSHFVVSHDRGQNVRRPEAYAELGKDSFSSIGVTIMPHVLRIPADVSILECRV